MIMVREKKEENNEEEEKEEWEKGDEGEEEESSAAATKCSLMETINPCSRIICNSQRKKVDLIMLI